MMARLLTIVALGFFLSDTLGADDTTKERETLQGTWKVLKYDIAKQDEPRDYIQKYGRVIIKGDKLTVLFVEEDRKHKVMEATFKVNPAKTPKAIDLTIDFISILLPDTADAKDILNELKGKTILGIYALEGDTLKFFAEEEGERPKDFPAKKRFTGVVTLQREKR